MRNNVARVAAVLLGLGLVTFVVALTVGGLSAAVIASFAYTPLLFIALITAVAALTRSGQPKRLAIVTLVLAIITAPVSLAFVATAVQLVTS
jgi:Na+/H+-dicarboxylate symporter